ncbi:Major facilitator superfamily [Colletotrichum karsti]|uniref:Major facilitator superfamily n=1 Tax=Colletotrichum karsti TaxID=1095194 RepID=A0A9P6I6V7_9PEZI|nr:Major facilitator superfamily [Colletotrichum karsti]KAF9878378.1 Major facilitator superfamily [Colletotrichum karsti]
MENTMSSVSVMKDDLSEEKHVENPPTPDRVYDQKETKAILRKVDWHLLPMLTLLYILSFIDRSNIGNAKIAGLNEDLKLTGSQYNIALTVFFVPYALLEIPSNMVLKVMRPSVWIGIMMLTWGAVMTLMGIVKDFSGLAGARAALGAAEAGFFPAATYLLTTWYRRTELQTRMAVFFSAASMSGAFSGLLAFALQKMDGIGKLAGWRWIFVIEGLATVVVGITCFFLLPDGPEKAKFLAPEERRFLCERLAHDAGTKAGKVGLKDKFHWPTIRDVFIDWKMWAAVIVYWGNTISLYGFTYTAPSVILGLGYSATNAQLLTIPIYILGVIGTPLVAYFADKHATRWPFIAGPYCISAIGFLGLLSIPHPALPGLTYAFLFCIPVGVYPPLIGLVAWVGNNLAPSWKRAVGMAFLIMMGNLGGVIGSNIYLEQQRPHFWLGFGFGLGISVAAVVFTIVLKFEYERLNRVKEALGTEEEILTRYSEDELLQMGDKSPLFRYIV